MKRSSLLLRVVLIICVMGMGLVGLAEIDAHAVRAAGQTSVGGGGGSMSVPSCPDSSGNHLNYASGSLSCGTSTAPNVWLDGTTGSIGGGLLTAGGCATGTATVAGAAVGTPVAVSAADGTNIPGLGVAVSAMVTSSNTVTVSVCALVALTPAAKAYNVRVIQ